MSFKEITLWAFSGQGLFTEKLDVASTGNSLQSGLSNQLSFSFSNVTRLRVPRTTLKFSDVLEGLRGPTLVVVTSHKTANAHLSGRDCASRQQFSRCILA